MEALLDKYFPNIDLVQKEQLLRLPEIYTDWNEKVNLISRKDIHNIGLHHIFHSIILFKFLNFKPGTRVLDLGTGGGFPGIPLSILMPEVNFTLIDGTLKKIRVVQDVAEKLKLQNVTANQMRAEEHKGKYDFVITRAVASMTQLIIWSSHLIDTNDRNALPNGIIAYKGGNIEKELRNLSSNYFYDVMEISEKFDEPWFREKYLVYLQV